MIATLIFILLLSFLVLIHELGHYLAAKWAKIKVHEFGLGYPPKALTLFKHQGTPFTLNWVPFGGFVRMEGEDGIPEEKQNKKVAKKVDSEAPFYTKTATQRLVVILAGVVVNFVFGIIAFSIVYSIKGIPSLIDQARIGIISENSPAAQAGIPTNVNITAVKDGSDIIPVSTNQEVIDAVSSRAGKEVILVTTGQCEGLSCQEISQEFSTYVRTAEETPEDQGAIGVGFSEQVFLFYPWYEQLVRGISVGVQQAVLFGVFIFISLAQLIRELFQFGHVPNDIAGPVGIVHQAQTQGLFDQGWVMILNFTGLLSVNLAIMNLLPIPALDGGRALFILLEKVIGRHRIQRVEGYANYGGFLLLIGLIVLITARDIWRLFI